MVYLARSSWRHVLVRVECRGPSVVTIALRKSGRRCNICCTFENDNIAQFEILEH